MADGGGFEPPIQLNTAYTLSRRAPSTTRPSIHGAIDRIRTYDPKIRNLVLYPAELRLHYCSISPSMHENNTSLMPDAYFCKTHPGNGNIFQVYIAGIDDIHTPFGTIYVEHRY